MLVNQKTHIKGLTLIELLVVITITVLLVVVAVPGFTTFIRNNQAASIATRLTESLRLARFEAIDLGVNVIVCSMDPGDSLATGVCNNSATVWNAWIIFADKDSDNIDDSGESIRYFEDIPSGAITTSSGPVKFDSTGFNVSGEKVFEIKPSGCTGKNAKRVTVMQNGSIQIESIDCES